MLNMSREFRVIEEDICLYDCKKFAGFDSVYSSEVR